jgi:hypothetical protein
MGREPELRPEFVEKVLEVSKRGKFVRVENFAEEMGLKPSVKKPSRTAKASRRKWTGKS